MRPCSKPNLPAWLAGFSALMLLGGAAAPAWAVPSFARQTGLACAACHTVFPELTPFGRVFKASGYTLDNLQQVQAVNSKRQEMLELAKTPALSIMAQVSYTTLKTRVPDASNAAAPGLTQNGTAGFPQQLSLFYAGKIAPHFGAFAQLTYANDSGTIGIDNTDLRFADVAILPHKQSADLRRLAQQQPDRAGPLEQHTGLRLPLRREQRERVAARRDPDRRRAGAGRGRPHRLRLLERRRCISRPASTAPPSRGRRTCSPAPPVPSTAPPPTSSRAARRTGGRPTNTTGAPTAWKSGLYGAEFKLLPGSASGTDTPLQGPDNRFNDVAEDLQYQYIGEDHIISVEGTRIHEKMNLAASYGAGAVANATDDLTTDRLWATYYYRRQIGGTLGWFSTTGSSDGGLYRPVPARGRARRRDQRQRLARTPAGLVGEVNYLPWLNVKLSLQYTHYTKFNGAGSELRRLRTQCVRQRHDVPPAVVCILRNGDMSSNDRRMARLAPLMAAAGALAFVLAAAPPGQAAAAVPSRPRIPRSASAGPATAPTATAPTRCFPGSPGSTPVTSFAS